MTMEEVRAECNDCRSCALCKTKLNTVFGTGNEHARLMFVGEAPGAHEDETGIPFVGDAGRLLDNYFDIVGIKRDEVYITNILKCRPPRNRDPEDGEAVACMSFLRNQIRIIDPKIIVCLGRISAARLIDSKVKIMRDHGIWVTKGRFEMCAVYHPSLLLRDPSRREEMLVDMMSVKHHLDALK